MTYQRLHSKLDDSSGFLSETNPKATVIISKTTSTSVGDKLDIL